MYENERASAYYSNKTRSEAARYIARIFELFRMQMVIINKFKNNRVNNHYN